MDEQWMDDEQLTNNEWMMNDGKNNCTDNKLQL